MPCSARELEVLRLLAYGLSDKEVARRLEISNLTVRKHRSHLLKKTGTANVCALVFLAARAGWISVVTVNAGEF